VDLRADDHTRRAAGWAANRVLGVPSASAPAERLARAVETLMHSEAVAAIVQRIGIARLSGGEVTQVDCDYERVYDELLAAFNAYRAAPEPAPKAAPRVYRACPQCASVALTGVACEVCEAEAEMKGFAEPAKPEPAGICHATGTVRACPKCGGA